MADKQNLKQTDPIKYYKKRKAWLGLAKTACTLIPPLTVLILYAVLSETGGAYTNPLVPWRFGTGIVMLIVVTIWAIIHELRTITKTNKASGNNGVTFTSSIIWLFMATILWLFYLTMFYLILLCFSEFIGCFLGAFCTSGIKSCDDYIDKNRDAEINAEAMVRVQQKHSEEKKKISIE